MTLSLQQAETKKLTIPKKQKLDHYGLSAKKKQETQCKRSQKNMNKRNYNTIKMQKKGYCLCFSEKESRFIVYERMEQRPMCPGTTGRDSTSGPRGAETLSTSPPADSAPSPSLPPLPPPPPSYCSSTLPPIKGTCYDLNIFHLFFTEKDFFQCFFFRPKFRVYMQNFGKVSGCMEPVTAAFSNHRATTYLL